MTTPVIDLPLDGADGVLRLVPWSGSEVREGQRYTYRLVDVDRAVASIEPRELFTRQPDDPSSGDFLPHQCVGDVRIVLFFEDGTEAATVVEVLPTKLEYETEYRAMLEQVADEAAEAVLQGFAPAALQAHADSGCEAATRYRSLAFLAARFRDQDFLAAIEQIRYHPHRQWDDHHERRPLGVGLRATPATARSLLRNSALAPPSHLAHLPMPFLPSAVDVRRTEATYDTVPNRFVRFAFGRWQGIALEVLDSLAANRHLGAGPLGRGRREAQFVVDRCEDVLALPAVREAGGLSMLPTNNQVLLRQPGYREVLRSFALAEASLALEAVLPDDPFSATQRNVAALYEYWCFVALARCLSSVAGVPPHGLLFQPSPTGLSLVLKQGEPSKLSWEMLVEGRALVVDLWFNRTFSRTESTRAEMGSWARQLRPDASIRIRPKSARPSEAADPELDVWLHFDAKYRIEHLSVDDPIEGEESSVVPDRAAKREDLLKMHAYRDAIRRSAGAYVLYPGSGPEQLRQEFHELLPGLGAFPLRPMSGGEANGAEALQAYLRMVTRHVANQASAAERTQYWTGRYNQRKGRRVRPVDFLSLPPADSMAAVGYVRSDQRAWVASTKQYNVRVGDRRGAVDLAGDVLAVDLVVLWTNDDRGGVEIVGGFERIGPWQLATADELMATGYPAREASNRYLITSVDPLPASVEGLISHALIEAHPNRRTGAPWSTTWADLTGTPE